jgi:hypothetical protein
MYNTRFKFINQAKITAAVAQSQEKMKKYAGDESVTKMVKDRRTEIKEEEENRAKGGKAAPTEHDEAEAGPVGVDCVSCMLAYRDAHVLFPHTFPPISSCMRVQQR